MRVKELQQEKSRLEQLRTDERIKWRVNGKGIHADNISMLNKSIGKINIEIETLKRK